MLITITLPSCNLFYKTVLGIKNPKMETYNTINEYAKTLTIDNKSLVFAKDSSSMYKLSDIFKGSPEILIFNKAKTFLPYKEDSMACNAPIGRFLKNICAMETGHVVINREINYDHFLSLLDDHNNVLGNIKDTTIDFIIFANFAKYVPKVNKTHIPTWDKDFNNHSGNCSAKIIYVDLDYLESWGISKKSLPKLRIRPNKK